MDRKRREELTIAAKVDAAVSRIVGSIEAMASEVQWTADQRFALKLIANRIGARSFGMYKAEQARAADDQQNADLIRHLATRIATIEQVDGEPLTLNVDEHVAAAARALYARELKRRGVT